MFLIALPRAPSPFAEQRYLQMLLIYLAGIHLSSCHICAAYIPLSLLFPLPLPLRGTWKEHSRRGALSFWEIKKKNSFVRKRGEREGVFYYHTRLGDNVSFSFGVIAPKVFPQKKEVRGLTTPSISSERRSRNLRPC